MADVILGAKIQIDTGSSTQAMASTVKGVKDMGAAAQQAQTQFAALSKQTQASFTSISSALGMNKAGEIAKAALDAKKAMGMLGAEALKTNQILKNMSAPDPMKGGSFMSYMAPKPQEVAQTKTLLDKFKAYFFGTANDVEKSAKQIERSGRTIFTSVRGWLPHVRTAFASLSIYFGVRTIQSIGQAADAYTNLAARLRIVTGSAAELAFVQGNLYRISQANQSGLEETTKLYTRMAIGMRDMGRSQADALAVVDLVGKSLKISGASSTEAAAGLLQFSQSLQAGLVAGDEYRSLTENMPRLAKAIADGLGISLGQLRKLSETQQLTADKAINALMKQSKALNSEAEKIPMTIGRAWTELGNAFLKLVADADQALGASRAIATGFEKLTKVIEQFNGSVSPLEKTRAKLQELRQEIAELEKQMAKPWWQRPIDITVMGPDKLKDLRKQLSGEQNRLGGLEKLDAQTTADMSAQGSGISRTAQEYVNAASAAWKLSAAQKAVVEQIVKIGEAEGFDPALLLSIAKVESTFNATAKAATSTASGVFQFIKGTAKHFGVADPFNVEQATHGAIKYLTVLRNQFKDTHLAAQAYHDGEGAVARAGNRVPSNSSDPGYGTRVLKNMEALQKAMGKASDDIGQDLAKAQKDQFDTYSEGLSLREKAYDDYAKVALAKNKTLVDQLQSQQQAAGVAAEEAMRAGDSGALARAEEELRRTIIARNDAAQAAIAIEEKAANKRLGNIGMEIAAAQKLGQANEVAKLQAERGTAKADLAAIEESRKQLTIQTNDDLLANARQFAEKRLQIERETQDARAAISQEVFQAAVDDQQAQIDSAIEQAKAQFALNEQQRQDAMANLTGLAAITQARENIKANLIDTLALIQAEKEAALDKLTLDAQVLDYQEQIAQWNQQHAATAQERLQAELALAKVHEQQATKAQKYLQVLNGVITQEAKARAAASKQGQKLDIQEVRESQLRMNAYWDQTISRMKDAQKIWVELLGSQADGFGDIAVSLIEFSKQLSQIESKYNDLAKQGKEADEAGQTRFGETSKAVAQSIAATAVGMRKMFEEGSNGYKAMTALAGAAALAQDAVNIADGIGAILKQLKDGDVYTAIPRAIAVAGMVAQLIGHAVGTIAAMGGGSSTVKAEDRQKTQGTGTVLGDTEAQSQSITNALETIKENSSADLAYSAGMLRSLQDLNLNILALANRVAVNVMPAIDDAIKASGMKFGMTNISLFSGFNKELTDAGIGWFETSLTDILNGVFDAKLYADITKSFEVMGTALSSSTKTYVADAGSEVSNLVSRIFRDIVGSLKEGGKAFGLSADDVINRLKTFKVGMEQISLKDMTMEEQQQALNAVFSKLTDQMARLVLPGLDAFQRASEGYAETFWRVADGINVASGLLAQAGLTASNYQDIILKQGDVAAEIVRQSISAFEGAFSTIGKYISGAVGSAEELLATYQDLLSIRAMSGVVGLSFRTLSEDMVMAAGGVSALRESLSYYIENFVGIGGTSAYQMTELTDQFRKLGLSVPESKEAFRDLVEGIDQTTPAGQKLYAQILKLGPAFITAAESAKQLEDLYSQLKGGVPFAEMNTQWTQLWEDWGTVMTGELAKVAQPFSAKISDQEAAIRSWQQAISAGTSAIGILTAEMVRLSLAGAPASAINKIGKSVETIIKSVDSWSASIKKAREEIKRLKDESGTAESTRRQELLREQGNSLIRNIMEMWSKMIDGISNLANSLQDQMDALAVDSMGATLGTANQRLTQAYGAYQAYKDTGGNDVNAELGYLQDIQSAVMARYNAELAVIQDAQAQYIEAETERLNAALQLQIDAINAATEAAIQAENDRLEAAIKVQSKIDAAAIKSQQKQFDAANKLVQKQFDAEIKAEQKAFDAANKLVQKQFDLEQKALQKAHDVQMKALTDELDAANKLRDAIKSVADYAAGMRLGQNSTLSPEARLAEAQRQYQTLVSAAQGGDVEAMSKLAGASDAYLEAAKTYYGSSTNYQDIFDGVQRAMESIGGMSAPDPDSIQSRIDLLREAQAEEMDKLRELQSEKLDAIRESQSERLDALRESQSERLDAIREIQAEQLDAIREAQQDNLDAMREASQKTADAIRDAAQRQIDEAQKQTQQAIADLSDPNKNAAIRELKERTIAELKAIQEQADKLRDQANLKALDWEREVRDWMTQQGVNDQDMIDALNAIHAAITGTAVAPSIPPAAPPSGNGTTPPPPGFNSWDDYWYWADHQNPIPGYAKGGYAQAGLALVGEQGPEIVRFSRPAQVMTADETRDALRGGNDGKIVQAIAELKAEMRAVVVTQSNANPQIIEKLSGMEQRLSKMERNARIQA